jgi:transposase
MPSEKNKETKNPQIRSLVVKLRYSGKTYKQIQKETGKSKSYVQRWVERFSKNGNVATFKRKNEKRKISNQVQKKIVNLVKSNNRYSCRTIAKKLKTQHNKCSKSSVHRILKKEGYRNVAPKKKPKLNETQQKNRLQFAKDYENKGLTFWKRVIFSDESPFEQGGNSSKVWVSKGEQTPILPTLKYPLKIQVWGAIGWKSKSPLYLIDKGKRLKAEDYQEIFNETLIPNAKKIACKPLLFYKMERLVTPLQVL